MGKNHRLLQLLAALLPILLAGCRIGFERSSGDIDASSSDGSDANEALFDGDGWWRLDETSGLVAADSSGNRNDGTLINMVGDEWTTGQNSGALALTSNEHVRIGNVLDPGIGSYSVSLWFRRGSTGPVPLPIAMASKGNRFSGREGWGLFLLDQNDGLPNQLLVRCNASNTTSQRASQVGPTVLDSDWHHFALVIDRGNNQIRGYFEGSNAGWQAGGGGPSSDSLDGFGSIDTSNQLVIGANENGGAYELFWGGMLDDLRIYRRVLSSAEIALLASQPP